MAGTLDHPRSRGVYPAADPARRECGGSSPLARGLHRVGGARRVRPGIIPARAGFTVRQHGRRMMAGDHPRSRGVYPVAAVEEHPQPGSSPLARGLRDHERRRARPRRIIPARAGFTDAWWSWWSPIRDHPRSRGVYGTASCSPSRSLGSSPLARGLRCPRRRRAPGRADHPRSRGVYCPTGSGRGSRAGSSPLARGLRRQPRAGARSPRIIPARAGFTGAPRGPARSQADHPRSRGVYASRPWRGPASPGSSPLARGLLALCTLNEKTFMDHPRSRGVYPRPWTSSPAPPGSSPLARGLLVGPHAGRGHHRIIPARAGFTEPAPRESLRSPDHPRSRGVYADTAVLAAQVLGSSPLARGLPCFLLTHALSYGIIPARAGFTTARRTTCLRRWDHPRSRGVYVGRSARAGPVAGSSPLARGLRHVDDDAAGRARIIPARAGFTPRQGPRPARAADHPRSRGVYGHEGTGGLGGSGSSPLARGLLRPLGVESFEARIIPARAGFTRNGQDHLRRLPDHPRSRGVYSRAAAE